MSRKFIYSFAVAAMLVMGISLSASAQYAPTSGTVEILNADGTKAPVAGALVEVYRMDIKVTLPSSKTDKKGAFVFAGLPLGANLTLAVSGPGANPMIWPGVKAGQEKILITLHPGDGRKLTEAEVRGAAVAGASTGGTTELSAEDKKAKADYEAKVAEVAAKNKKIESSTKVVEDALKAGLEAYNAKNYDLAITEFSRGVDAEPNYVGVTPVLLNNRGASLDSRAVDTYNKFAKAPDPTERREGMDKAKADLAASIASYKNSYDIIKTAPATDVQNPQAVEAARLTALRGARSAFRHAVQTEQVDPTLIDAAKVLIPEYLTIETDAARKSEAELTLADLYRVTADSDNAIPAYKKILETSPENLDALSGVGFSLVNNGYIKNDKAQLQEGANYLQKFISLAPDTNKFKGDAVALIDNLKKEQNVAPQKVTGGKTKGKP